MRKRWLSGRAVALHFSVLVFVPGCGLAAWWQITRAFDGNGLSYLYSVEWPIFAILSVYFWWMLIHTDYDNAGIKGVRKQQALAADQDLTSSSAADPIPASVSVARADDPESDPELAAYNARLADLAAQGPKTWRRPETHVARRPS